MKWRIDLNCKNMDELVERIIKICDAGEFK